MRKALFVRLAQNQSKIASNVLYQLDARNVISTLSLLTIKQAVFFHLITVMTNSRNMEMMDSILFVKNARRTISGHLLNDPAKNVLIKMTEQIENIAFNALKTENFVLIVKTDTY